MVAPNAAGASFDVLLQFSLDEAANKRVADRTSTIEQELKRIQDEAAKAGKSLDVVTTNLNTKTKNVEKSVVSLGAQVTKLGERAQESSKKVDQAIDKN